MGGCYGVSRSTIAEASHRKADFIDISGLKVKENNNINVGSVSYQKLYLQSGYVSENILQLDFKKLVSLPDGLDLAEWIASNTVGFFKQINIFSSAMSEFCTGTSCPVTDAAGNKIYYWHDEQGKKLKCSAPLYTDYAMSYIQELLEDENVFPTKIGSTFPPGFIFMAQKIFLYLFHILAHFYWAHFQEIARLELHPHLNTLYFHFISFSQEFKLLEPQETAIMDELSRALLKHNLC
ncbi:MOB kinase activator 2 isoform X1 [Polypterus senegalus]|uniref:MOB kinase activator 2 isoform X1 n=1 Tax=Polypterus senegalus TaxID=55291 RepID=UPI0019643ACB|nr:MOB kinase activator 2 isoform X1 [Polypterus senegalus]